MRFAFRLLLIAAVGSFAGTACEDDSLYATGEPVPVMPGGGSDAAATDVQPEAPAPADVGTTDVPRETAAPVDTATAD